MIRIQHDYSFQLFNSDKWREVLDELAGIISRSDFPAFEGIVRELIFRLERQPEPDADGDYLLFCRYASGTPENVAESGEIAKELLVGTVRDLSLLKTDGWSSLSRLRDVIDMYIRYRALEGFRDFWFCDSDFVVSMDLWPGMQRLVETAHDRDTQSELMRLTASFMSMMEGYEDLRPVHCIIDPSVISRRAYARIMKRMLCEEGDEEWRNVEGRILHRFLDKVLSGEDVLAVEFHP